jgi:hypothetical protein
MTTCNIQPIPVAASSEVCVSVASRLPDLEFVSLLGHECPSLESFVFCHVVVTATGRSFVQRCPTEYGVSEYDFESSEMRESTPCMAVEE